jgi:hypothetical protein
MLTTPTAARTKSRVLHLLVRDRKISEQKVPEGKM